VYKIISLIKLRFFISFLRTSFKISLFFFSACEFEINQKSTACLRVIYGIKVLIKIIFSLSLNRLVSNKVLISLSTNLPFEISSKIAITSFFLSNGDKLSNLFFFSSSDKFQISTGNKEVLLVVLNLEILFKNFSNFESEFK
jgi:hypothetical protein